MYKHIPLIFLFFSSMITENLVFARAVGIEELSSHSQSIKKISSYAFVVFVICLPAVLICYPIKYSVLGAKEWAPFSGFVVVCALSLCCLVLFPFLKAVPFLKKTGFTLNAAVYLSLSCTCVSAVLFALQFTTVLTCVVYLIGSCFGIMLSMILLRSGRERLQISRVSEAFKGFPIMLIYIGILSMALFGLVGHKLLA